MGSADVSEPPLESTATLIRRFQDGDRQARDRLVERCLPLLQRWARGRLPSYGRDLSDTDDIVQVTMMRALRNVETFRTGRQGAFLAYLRTILLNVVRDEIRRTARKPQTGEANESLLVGGSSPLEELVSRQTVDGYEAALATLPEEQREAVVLRVEFGLSFAEVALELDIPSADAARMRVSRGLVKLAEAMP
jgi:RNA polymerase sigma-70 factor (ECF subfamily)